jgi:hypothetical protein
MLLSLSRMPYILECSVQKNSFRYLRKILCIFQLREVESQVSTQMAQSCVRTPFSVKKSNSSILHPSGRHGDTIGRTSRFEKIPAFLHRQGVGRQLELVRTLGQHRPDAKILDKEIACIHSASIRTTGQHC